MIATKLAAQTQSETATRSGQAATSAETAYTISKDEKDGGRIFNGVITFNDLNNEESFYWMRTGRSEYTPDDSKVATLKKLNDPQYKNYKLVVFMGTWCSDSHDLIPKLEKVLDEVGFPAQRLTMYGVDRSKTTNGGQEKQYHITNVPTIILFNSDNEIGRITESVQKSVEADLAAFLQ
jgi:thiol-disulfide isomerase/thioredoxin